GLRHAPRRAAPDPHFAAEPPQGASRGASASRGHRETAGRGSMKGGIALVAGVVVLAVGLGAGYWWGNRAQPASLDQATAAGGAVKGAPAERKIKFYRNPMGLPDTSPVPKKDPMGMDYIPVHEGEEPEAGSNQVRISVDKVQKLGVRSEPASMRT